VKGKVGLEEHFAIEDTLNDSKGFLPDDVWPELRGRLIDIHDRRIAEMDRHGVEMMVLSLNAPAVQAILDPTSADALASGYSSARDLVANADNPMTNTSFDTIYYEMKKTMQIAKDNLLS